eukprot:TRINITY_DN17460_c0_g1_i1.p1 TRINITY_DN17460_c0_g1~~TRINITY_DN17460_c0_g1_i1.p1  ORF type:complete len:140 (+),score=33.53 TRINITY_DN17460_c0_g1_i1:233-652(+)
MTSVLPGSLRAAVIRNLKLTRQSFSTLEVQVNGPIHQSTVCSEQSANLFTSARMEGNAASYQEKVERTPGDKFPEADTRQKDHEKDTHAAQHEKVRESEELGGYTDEAQAEAAAKAAAYFEFRKGAKQAQEKGPDVQKQ